jgi:segregation and condensation protein B
MSLKAKFEAVIYAAEEPVTLAQLAALFSEDLTLIDEIAEQQPLLPEGDSSEPGPDAPEPEAAAGKARAETAAARAAQRKLREAAKLVVDDLIADYASQSSPRGMEIREVAGGYRMATKPEYHDAVRGFIKSLKPALKLSLPALETLAVIAYKQPVTAPEIGEIRGVDSAGVLGGLLARKLITTAGRKQVLGRPILYKTTQEFLLRFGLKDVGELPSLEEFEKMAAEVAEFDDAPASPQQAAQEEAALAQAEQSEPDVPVELEAGSAPQAVETGSLAVEVEDKQPRP